MVAATSDGLGQMVKQVQICPKLRRLGRRLEVQFFSWSSLRVPHSETDAGHEATNKPIHAFSICRRTPGRPEGLSDLGMDATKAASCMGTLSD